MQQGLTAYLAGNPDSWWTAERRDLDDVDFTNLSYTGKAVREMSLATGRQGFTIDSFLDAASKFGLQREKTEEPILSVVGGFSSPGGRR